MSRASAEAQAYAVHTKGAAGSTQAFVAKQKEAQEELKATASASKTASVSMKLLSAAGNMIAMWAVSEAISLVSQVIDDYIHKAENARKKSKELTATWTEENSSIDDSISKYKELQSKLRDTSLSAEQVKSVKEQLSSIQDSLVQKYGQEALGIDLVNGKYDEQIDKLKKLSKQKAQEYVAQNYSNIQEDKKYVNDSIKINKSLGNGALFDSNSYNQYLQKYLDNYDHLSTYTTETDGVVGSQGLNIVGEGTREEIYDQLTALFNDLSNDFGNSNPEVNALKNSLSGIIQDSFDTEQMKTSKDNLKNYAEAQILSQDHTRKLYEDAAIAVDKYNKALESSVGVNTAKKNLDSIKESVNSAVADISGASYVFDDIYNGINSTAETAYNISKAFENDSSIKEYAEQLKGLSSDDLLKINFEDEVEQSGEAAFKSLMEIIGLSEDQVQSLINKLIELGYVKGTIQDSRVTSSNNLFDLGTDSTRTNLGKLSEEIDTIQSAYSTLSSAIAEYNSQGSFSIDTMQSVIALGDNWLDYLVDENGMLQLDEQSLENLTKSRIEDMKQQALSTLASNVSGIQSEADANNYLASANYNAATSYKALANAELEKAKADLKSKFENGETDITSETYEKLMNQIDSQAEKIQNVFDNTDFTFSSDNISESSVESLENHANILKSVKEEYEGTGRISSSTLSSIAKAYPEMNEALRRYRTGLITEQELFKELENCYENDTNQYIRALVGKSKKDEEFFNVLKTNYPEIFNQLAENCYGVDVKNWTTMENAKLDITRSLKAQLEELWADYFKDIDNTFGAYGDILENADGSGYTYIATQEDSFDYDHTMSEEEWQASTPAIGAFNSVKKQITGMINWANNAVSKLDTIASDYVSSTIDTSWDGLSGYDSGSFSDSTTPKDYDLIERAITRLEHQISNLGSIADDTYSTWSERNSALADEISTVTDEIHLQQQAQEKYMDLANAVGLDDTYKDLIMNGGVDILTVEDEALQNQIDLFMDYYDKAQEAADSVSDLNNNLKELQKTKFDNISEQFEKIRAEMAHTIKMLNSYLDLADTQDFFAPSALYEKLISHHQTDLSKLYAERDSLNAQLQESVNVGFIKEESEAWYDMRSQINSVNEEIINTIIEIEKLNNDLTNMEFEKFDYMQDSVSDLTSEADFYINFIESMKKEFHDDNGRLTDEGMTTAGLHAQNYNTYLQQAKEYTDKIKAINLALVNDPTNTILLNKKKEYIEAQRESILSAQDERNSIADLIKDGYDKQLKALSDLIDKYKDLLSADSDAYNYEKSMSEKTKALAALQKQYAAYQGDDSEEGRKYIQQLEAQIEQAKDDIEQTEYEKLISDTEKLLDSLQSEYETLINERIDNIDTELTNITDAINGDGQDSIKNTLEKISSDSQLALSQAMSDIWKNENAQPVIDINASVNTVNNTLSGTNQAIQEMRNDLQNLFSKMQSELERQIAQADDGSYQNNVPDSQNTPSALAAAPNTASGADTSDDNNEPDDWSIYKYYYPQELNTETSVVDRLKANNIDASKSARSRYWDMLIGDGEYVGDYDQNITLLNWLKDHGYRNGTRSASKGLHLFDENGLGSEILITKEGILKQFDGGERVLNSEMADNLYRLAQENPPSAFHTSFQSENFTLPSTPNKGITNQYQCGNISLEFPNVNNYEDFVKQAQSDAKFEKMIQEMSFGQALGHNHFQKRVY